MKETVTPQDREQVEGMIDSLGTVTLLRLIGDICEEKAMHLEDNWQDRSLAAIWRRAARLIMQAANKMPERL